MSCFGNGAVALYRRVRCRLRHRQADVVDELPRSVNADEEPMLSRRLPPREKTMWYTYFIFVNVSISVSSSRNAFVALCTLYASTTSKEKFSGPDENCQRTVPDLAGSLVTSCRPPGRLQKRPYDRTSNAGVAVRTADGSRRTADAADEQCLSCACSSASCIVWCLVLQTSMDR